MVDGMKKAHPSKKQYRPHHRSINKKLAMFDNDNIFLFGESPEEFGKFIYDKEHGINKNVAKFSDYNNSDLFKDGNN